MWTAGQIWGFTHENHHHHQLTSISIAPDRFFSTPKLKWDSKVGLLVIFPCYHFHHFLGQGSIIHFQISKSLSLSLSLTHTHTHTHTPPHVPSAAALGVLEPRTTFVPASPAPKATCSLCCNEPLGLNSPLCWTELRTSDASEPRGMETMTLEYYLTIKENAVPVHAEYPRTLRALCQVEETRHNRPHIV